MMPQDDFDKAYQSVYGKSKSVTPPRGVPPDEEDEFDKLYAQQAASQPAVADNTSASGRKLGGAADRAINAARVAAQGAFLGLPDEAEALVRSWRGGETYAQAKQDIAEKMAAYREEYPKEALALELAGGVATGLVGGARALAATAGRAGLREALKAGAKTALASNVGQGAISGYGAGEGGALSGERIKGAAIGGTVGAALPFVASKAASKVARYVSPTAAGQAASSAYGQAQRFVADRLPTTGRMAFLGRAIEPTDITRIQREASSSLPGALDGPTAQSLNVGASTARAAQQQAAIAAAEAKGKASLTASELRAARSKAAETMRQAKEQAGATQSLTKQRAEAVEAMGKSRAERLSEASKAAEAEAKAIQSGAAAELKQTATATREQAKLAAEEALEEARGEAAAVVGGMRGRQPRGAANKLQETVRSKQLREAEGHYEALRAVGAPPEPDPEVYKEIFADPALRSAYDGAVSTIKKEARNATPGAPAVTPTRTITINGTATPEITLETMDQMRRKILNPPYDPNKVGLTRSQKTQALETINRLEERYLAGFGTDEAAEAVRAARGPYREKFETLEAVRDGLNLGSVKAGKISGILKQGTKELDEVVKRVEQMTPKQRTAFQVGAREWFDRALQESSADALAIAKKFSTEASQRRLALAYGDEAVEALRAFAPDIVGKRQAAAAARVREEGAQLAQQITGRAEAAATPLQSRAERAADLAERAKTEKAARAQQLVTQGKSAQEQAVLNARRLAETDVRTARQAAEAAQTDAQKMAQSLAQAKVASASASKLSVKNVAGALGESESAARFLQETLPNMNPQQQQEAVAVLGSQLQRQIKDMADAGMDPQDIIKRINVLQKNEVVKRLFGPQMNTYVQQLYPTIGTRLPKALQTSTAGLLGRQFGGGR